MADVDRSICREVAAEIGLTEKETACIVRSFFTEIVREARRLPFDDGTRIYKNDRFIEIAKAVNLPYLGRTGPVYGKYLKWRRKEAEKTERVKRKDCRAGLTRGEIEDIAAEALAGRVPQIKERKKSKMELYGRVWMIGKDGRKLARQAFVKQTEQPIKNK